MKHHQKSGGILNIHTNLILKLDYAYVDKLLLNYSGDNFTISKGEFVCGEFHPKPEFTCERADLEFTHCQSMPTNRFKYLKCGG